MSLNFDNRNQTCSALALNKTADHVVFHASVSCQIRQIRVIFANTVPGNATNYVETRVRTLKGTVLDNVGDEVSTEEARAVGDIVEIVNQDSDALHLEKGDSLVLSATRHGTGAVELSVAVDAEITGSR